MQILTQRLKLSLLDDQDSAFILALLNDPDWLKYIGDKGVRNLDDARDYIHNGPLATYQRHGYCMLKVCARESGLPLGLCGLLKRDNLEHPDVGYAFLPQARGTGYAKEAVKAVVAYAQQQGHSTLMAFCLSTNQASIKVLESAGFRLVGPYEHEGATEPLVLYQRIAER
ncbi:GNAT family N-acetyltransferase [Bowmanella pacifica]|uniref:Alanine acetyltransferase n=1 Tax=Bowmanella pacifica TaxID=502051 RepID=A0A917YTU4_9ALTE|nr:GNAT family N-acetyltransferase [Bowmanella pacifica]GGO65844.1 alanine acetyltransferase [Bowmanella pacifica]